MKQLFSSMAFVLCLALLSSCNKKDQFGENTFYGTAVPMGDGTARSWVQLDNAGIPQQIGIEMTPEAFDNLPHIESLYSLNLPAEAKQKTAFQHLAINWNPHGHMPAMVYDRPHFDFHFYTMTEVERLAIPTYAANPVCFDKDPAKGFLPDSYVSPPGGSDPQMGKHWVDVNSPELNGQAFTRTFVYGTYDGKVNFYEPMVTYDVMKAGYGFSSTYPQPKLFQKANTYYPTVYNSFRANGKFYITLSDFVLR